MTWYTEGSLAERYDRATLFFEAGDHAGAARILADMAEDAPESTAVLELLARAYFHSAQLTHAEERARELIERQPDNAYAHLVLARTLERQSRHEEARPHLRMVAVMSDYVDVDERLHPQGGSEVASAVDTEVDDDA